jgi:hypothetical protein
MCDVESAEEEYNEEQTQCLKSIKHPIVLGI